MLTSDEDIDVVTSSHGHTISDSGRDPAGPFFVLRLRSNGRYYEKKILTVMVIGQQFHQYQQNETITSHLNSLNTKRDHDIRRSWLDSSI
jgi:hypothetical protein